MTEIRKKKISELPLTSEPTDSDLIPTVTTISGTKVNRNITFATLAAKAKGDPGTTSWAGITDKPSSFTPSAHIHTASDTTDFDTEVSNNTDVSANTTARHTHANKTLLDTYSQTEVNLADAVAKKHTHANSAVLDATTASFTTADETKLDGIAAGATANSSDATLLARANHTGTQSADTITDGTTNKTYTATEKTKLAGIATGAQVNTVTSVNTRTGAVTGLAEASDLTAHTGNTSNPHSVTKAQVGLSNADNTSDVDKPISTATQTALDGKFTQRTITGTINQVNVSNGNGVSGNPTLSLPSAITTPGSLTITGHNSPQADSTYTLGTSSLYWSNTYTKRVYFNSTNYVTGEYAGVTQFVASSTGNVAEFKNTVNDTKFALNAVSGKGSFVILGATSHYRAFIADGNGTLYWRIGNYGNNSLAFRTNSDGFTGYTDALALTIDGTQKAKFFGDIESADKNIILGTTTGTKIGTSTSQKLGFFNATPVVQPSATPVDATDLATALTLVNNLKSKLVTLGLIA